MLRRIGSGQDPVTPLSAIQPGAPARAGWHDVARHRLEQIAGYLDDAAVCALARADKHHRDALAPMVRSARIVWHVARVSNLSMLQDALREIEGGGIPPHVRAEYLAALAERLPLAHPFLGTVACHFMIKAVQALPAALRQRPLCALLSCCGKLAHAIERRKPMHHVEMARSLHACQRPLLQLVIALPQAHQPAALLAFCSEFPQLRADVAAELPACLQRAMAWPQAHCVPLIAAMLRAVRSLGEAPVALVDTVRSAYQALAQADPATMGKRTAVLCVLADEASPAWLHADHTGMWARLRVWVLEAARTLPLDSRLQVLTRVAAWRHAGSSADELETWHRRVWTDGLAASTDAAARARWFANFDEVAHGAWLAPAAWGGVWEEARGLAPRSCAPIIASLASSLGLLPHQDRRDAWTKLFAHAARVLPIDYRAYPLQALAVALLKLSGVYPDSDWDAIIEAAADLPPAGQVPVLYEFCVGFPEVCEHRWNRYLDLLAQVPADTLRRELQRAGDPLRQLSQTMAVRALPRLVTSLQRLPADERDAPWLALWRLSGVIFGAAERPFAWDCLLQATALQTPVVQERWLVAAAAIDHADAYLPLLKRAACLPTARRASVLSELALGAAVTRRPLPRLQIWQALVEAVRALPPAYRGSPLHALRELQIELSGEEAPLRETVRALSEGVPPIDVPGGCELPDRFTRSALHAPKRARQLPPAPGAPS